jgi:hypothetical protein
MPLGDAGDGKATMASRNVHEPAMDLKNTPSILLPHLPKRPIEPDVIRWNTTNLGLRLGADASCAATASILVAPIICVIDRYAA